MTEKNPRGRPRHGSEKMTKRGVSMPPEYWKQAEALGGGEASAGIRKALDDLEELSAAVLEWWNTHHYDTVMRGDEEYNVFDEEPRFVTIALGNGDKAGSGKALEVDTEKVADFVRAAFGDNEGLIKATPKEFGIETGKE